MMKHVRPIQIDGATIYLLSYTGDVFLRYIEGDKHLTLDYGFQFSSTSDWWYVLPDIIRILFAPKKYLLILRRPVCWDNEEQPIPEEHLLTIKSHLEQAFNQRYRRSQVVLLDKGAPSPI